MERYRNTYVYICIYVHIYIYIVYIHIHYLTYVYIHNNPIIMYENMYSIHTRIWIYVYLYTCTHTLTFNFIYIKNVYAKTWIKPFSTSSDWHLYKKSIWSFLLSMRICSQIFPIHIEVKHICKYLKGIGKPIHTHTHTHTHTNTHARTPCSAHLAANDEDFVQNARVDVWNT